MSRISRSLIFVAVFSFLLVLPSLGLTVFASASNSAVTWSPSNAPTVSKNSVWAGYGIVAPNAGVMAIRASFVQPAVKCNPKLASQQLTGYFAGLDGAISSDFEIVGTAASCALGATTATYGEVASASVAPIIPIVVGHTYQASIVLVAGVLHYALKDANTGVTSKGTGPAPSVITSAECIVDRGSVGGSLAPLANFGTISFGKDFTGVKNTCYASAQGKTMAIGASSSTTIVEKYVMYNKALTQVDASTSALTADKASFKVTELHAGP